jgi:multidrug efflux pump subunit AcrA (membrane-fusion protein)
MVGSGTPLGYIDTPELDQQIIQARATLQRTKAQASLAKSTAARWNDLLTSNSVSHQEADEKNAGAATATATVAEAQANLGRLLAMKSYATVRAPSRVWSRCVSRTSAIWWAPAPPTRSRCSPWPTNTACASM